MINDLRTHVLAVSVLVLGCALPAAAQQAPTVELSGGYQLLRSFSGSDPAQTFPVGWYADIAGNVTNAIAIVGEVGGNYKTLSESVDLGELGAGRFEANANLKLHGLFGGVRISARNTHVVPFAQILGGAMFLNGSVAANGNVVGIPMNVKTSVSDTRGAVRAGGGVNVMPSEHIGARVGVDYVHVFAPDSGGNGFSFTAGVVVPFGK
jgi:hypothetical protein